MRKELNEVINFYFNLIQNPKKVFLWQLWLIQGILMALDVLSTFIGLHLLKGFVESNPYMVNFVQNPLYDAIIKIGAFLLFFIILNICIFMYEKRKIQSDYRNYEKIVYYLCYVCGIVIAICYELLFVSNNMLLR